MCEKNNIYEFIRKNLMIDKKNAHSPKPEGRRLVIPPAASGDLRIHPTGKTVKLTRYGEKKVSGWLWRYFKIAFLVVDAVIVGVLLERWLGNSPSPERKEVIARHVQAVSVAAVPSAPKELPLPVARRPVAPVSHDDKILAAVEYIEEKGRDVSGTMQRGIASHEQVVYNIGKFVADDSEIKEKTMSLMNRDIAATAGQIVSDIVPVDDVAYVEIDYEAAAMEDAPPEKEKRVRSGEAYLTLKEQRFVEQSAYIYKDLGDESSEHYTLFRKILETYDDDKVLDKENWPVVLAEKSYNEIPLARRYAKGVPPNGFTLQQRKTSASDAVRSSRVKKDNATRTALKITPLYQRAKYRLQNP